VIVRRHCGCVPAHADTSCAPRSRTRSLHGLKTKQMIMLRSCDPRTQSGTFRHDAHLPRRDNDCDCRHQREASNASHIEISRKITLAKVTNGESVSGTSRCQPSLRRASWRMWQSCGAPLARRRCAGCIIWTCIFCTSCIVPTCRAVQKRTLLVKTPGWTLVKAAANRRTAVAQHLTPRRATASRTGEQLSQHTRTCSLSLAWLFLARTTRFGQWSKAHHKGVQATSQLTACR
jgi:hypothetical protein